MFRDFMDKHTGRQLATDNLATARKRAEGELAKAVAKSRAATNAQISLKARLARIEQQENLLIRSQEVPSDLMIYTASYLLLCGRNNWPPSLEHAKMVERPFPRKTKALSRALGDVLALGWGTLSEFGRLTLTPKGVEELEALKALRNA
jgi:hypothetical protein